MELEANVSSHSGLAKNWARVAPRQLEQTEGTARTGDLRSDRPSHDQGAGKDRELESRGQEPGVRGGGASAVGAEPCLALSQQQWEAFGRC